MRKRESMLVALMLALAAPAVAGFGPCEDERFGPRARCGSITVPEDRGKPDGQPGDESHHSLLYRNLQGRAVKLIVVFQSNRELRAVVGISGSDIAGAHPKYRTITKH